jgi:hypothetical protein
MSDDIVIEEGRVPDDRLSEREQRELWLWKRGKDTAPLALSTALKMYELFLLGHSCEEIARANENRFSLGLILDARIRHNWDERRRAHLDHIYNDVGELVRQRQTESAVFLGDILAVAHKEYGNKFRKYLQSGDPNDLDNDMKVTSITTYKRTVEALMKVTGQDRPSKDSATLVQVNADNVTMSAGPQKQLQGEQAHSLIRLLDEFDKEGKAK